MTVTCKLCKAIFARQQHLNRHLNNKKFPCNRYICKSCDVKFPNGIEFKIHVRNNDCAKPENNNYDNLNHGESQTFSNDKEPLIIQLELTKAATGFETAKSKANVEKAKVNIVKTSMAVVGGEKTITMIENEINDSNEISLETLQTQIVSTSDIKRHKYESETFLRRSNRRNY